MVDDHGEIREEISALLTRSGYRVSAAADGRQLRQILRASKVDLIILDIMLPGEDGLTICRNLRASSNIPIVMLTAKGDEFDKVLGLEMGADDYVAKPFGGRELVARIKAVLRRTHSLPPSQEPARIMSWKFDRWTLDAFNRHLTSDEEVLVVLSTAEFDLLMAFIQRPRIVLSREQLLDITQGLNSDAFDRSIDTRVSRLRRKIEADHQNPEIVRTVWGSGYMFTPDVTAE